MQKSPNRSIFNQCGLIEVTDMGSNLLNEKKIFVAQYLRMSTDHQQFSIDNQAQFIRKYAEDHNMDIIHTYDDEGKSGITTIGRNNFNQLIEDVVTGRINIEAVLVYDVSRFGRFQDNDEAGHYSYLLKYHGVRVIYCAENLPDQSPEIQMLTLPALRYAAGAYSKNLSIKVFSGHANLVNRGYYQGGIPGYGLRRKLIDASHNEKFILKPGERKSIQTDRVVLTPGTEHEINIINRIFNMFIFESYNEYIIAEQLNQEGIKHSSNSEWNRSRVHAVLINERYTGTYIYNKTSGKLKTKKIKNPKEDWIIKQEHTTPIIGIEKFKLAQTIINNRTIDLTNEDIMNYLRKKLKENGKLSGLIIDEDDLGPSSSVIANRFGGLMRAYQLIGYTPERDYSYIETNRELRKRHIEIFTSIYEQIKIKDSKMLKTDSILINNNLKISLTLSKCKKTESGSMRWIVRFERRFSPDINIVVRMDSSNTQPVDYYIFPSIENIEEQIKIKEKNPLLFELYRFDNLNILIEMLSTKDREVA